jgi:hypothetical protein
MGLALVDVQKTPAYAVVLEKELATDLDERVRRLAPQT